VPQINRESLREQLSDLEAQYVALGKDKEITPDTKALITSLLILLKLLCSIFLEKSTKKNAKNSSIPPSQSDPDNTSKSKGVTEKAGAKAGFEQEVSQNTRSRERIEILQVIECAVCGEDLEEVACTGNERRTLIDIVFEKVVLHQDAEIKTCPECNATTKGSFDAEMQGPLQYGVGLRAFVIHLLITQMVPIGRTLQTVGALFGVVPSPATLLNWITSLYHALEAWENEAVRRLLSSPVINTDETSHRISGSKWWVHVYSADRITLKFLHKKRGQEAMNAFEIIAKYTGTLVHDCWASYLGYSHCQHALCGSHLLRELTFIIESNDYRWAKNMKKLLKATACRVARSKRKKLTKRQYANLEKNYKNILTRGESELPEEPVRSRGKRGRIAKSDAANLHERLIKYQTEVLRFAADAHVPFTNNRAERDLRMEKVKQKIAGCFRTVQMAHAYCRISSYLKTMAYHGVNPVIAIQYALSGSIPGWTDTIVAKAE
jgi:transposase